MQGWGVDSQPLLQIRQDSLFLPWFLYQGALSSTKIRNLCLAGGYYWFLSCDMWTLRLELCLCMGHRRARSESCQKFLIYTMCSVPALVEGSEQLQVMHSLGSSHCIADRMCFPTTTAVSQSPATSGFHELWISKLLNRDWGTSVFSK